MSQVENASRSFKRALERERKKYNGEWILICNWFVGALFGTEASYKELYSYGDRSWRSYCEVASRSFKKLQPNPDQFHNQFKPLERV